MDAQAVTEASNDSVAGVIAALTREVADFPEPGIQFKDLTPVLADHRGLAVVTEALATIAEGADLVAGIDARGFLLGGAVAHRLGVGVLAIRKGGKLPPPVHRQSYTLEYGNATPTMNMNDGWIMSQRTRPAHSTCSNCRVSAWTTGASG